MTSTISGFDSFSDSLKPMLERSLIAIVFKRRSTLVKVLLQFTSLVWQVFQPLGGRVYLSSMQDFDTKEA